MIQPQQEQPGKVFPATYLDGKWLWCKFQEVMEIIKLPGDVLLDSFANISSGWNLVTLWPDHTRRLWTTVDIDPTVPESTNFMVPQGWVKSVTEHPDLWAMLRPEKQIELLTVTFWKQGYFIVRMKPEERLNRLAYVNPIVEKLEVDFPVEVGIVTSSYNELHLFETVDLVVFNKSRWHLSIYDDGQYPNGLDPAYRLSGSIRIDRIPKEGIPPSNAYLHPHNRSW